MEYYNFKTPKYVSKYIKTLGTVLIYHLTQNYFDFKAMDNNYVNIKTEPESTIEIDVTSLGKESFNDIKEKIKSQIRLLNFDNKKILKLKSNSGKYVIYDINIIQVKRSYFAIDYYKDEPKTFNGDVIITKSDRVSIANLRDPPNMVVKKTLQGIHKADIRNLTPDEYDRVTGSSLKALREIPLGQDRLSMLNAIAANGGSSWPLGTESGIVSGWLFKSKTKKSKSKTKKSKTKKSKTKTKKSKTKKSTTKKTKKL